MPEAAADEILRHHDRLNTRKWSSLGTCYTSQALELKLGLQRSDVIRLDLTLLL